MNDRQSQPDTSDSSASLVAARSAKVSRRDSSPQSIRRVFVGGTVRTASLEDPSAAPVATQPDSPCATAFRLLARQLEHLGDCRSMTVTSPARSEGKSFCALNLALALAAGGTHSVLLVEAHVQHPVLAKRIGLRPPRCIGEWMRNAMNTPDAPFRAVEVCFPTLHVLAVDAQIENAQSLVSRGFEAAMQQLRFSAYRYIVVDAPPVAGSADAALIADATDGVVLCAAKGRTKKSDILDAGKQLEPIPVVAKVLLET